MKIVWRRAAEADRERIFDYIARDNPHAALALDEQFDIKTEIAARNPKLYRTGRVRGTREIVVRPNYLMVYRAQGNELTILRILHAAQQWPLPVGSRDV